MIFPVTNSISSRVTVLRPACIATRVACSAMLFAISSTISRSSSAPSRERRATLARLAMRSNGKIGRKCSFDTFCSPDFNLNRAIFCLSIIEELVYQLFLLNTTYEPTAIPTIGMIIMSSGSPGGVGTVGTSHGRLSTIGRHV